MQKYTAMSNLDQNEAALIRQQVSLILNSPPFANSDQLKKLLRFIVEQKLAGQEELKEYTVATDALGKDKEFDPKTDNIVRREATRLREKLEKYYAEEAGNPPVRILVPKGQYLPVFDITPLPERSTLQRLGIPLEHKKALQILGVVVVAGLAAIAILFTFLQAPPPPCAESVEITSPQEGSEVGMFSEVSGTREPAASCKAFLVIEALGHPGSRFVQGQLAGGKGWHVQAQFGERTTEPGTAFIVYVLSTRTKLPIFLPPDYTLPQDATESQRVHVQLRK